jgi:type IV secretion system protein TrbJ
MRKRIVSAVLLLAVGMPTLQPARAGVFATEVTQLLNHAQLVMQYIRQGTQLANELNMYADMLRNVRQVPFQTFGPIAADINQLAGIVQGGQALAYSLANLDARFRGTFPGYGSASNVYYVQYKNWAQTTLDTTLGTLRAAGLQGQQLQSEQAVLSSLRNMAQNSDGRMQALQVLGQISEQQVQQLMKLRELMMADMSSKQAYQASIIQQQATSEAATQQFFTGAAVSGDGVTFRPGLH